MAIKDPSIAARLARAHLAITNAPADKFIMNAVARFNYDEVKNCLSRKPDEPEPKRKIRHEDAKTQRGFIIKKKFLFLCAFASLRPFFFIFCQKMAKLYR